MSNKGIDVYEDNGRRVVKGIGYYKSQQIQDLRELIKQSAEKYGELTAFKFKSQEGSVATKSFRQFSRDIDCLGTAFISLGLKGEKIAIIGENRYEWGMSYFAVVNGTGIVVPLDKYLPKNEIDNLVKRANVKAVVYSPAFHETMLELARENEKVDRFICMESIDPNMQSNNHENVLERFTDIPRLLRMGGQLLDEGNTDFLNAEIDRSKMSILLFTSGTTSISKGVMLSHQNVCANVSSITSVIKAEPGDVHLSILPLHHTFENTIGLMYMIHNGVCVAFSEGVKYIAQNINEFGVTVLVAVPAIFEAIYKKLQEGIKKSGKEAVYKIMLAASSILLKFGIDLRRKFFKNVFDKIGPRLRLAVSGAAPIDPGVVKGFEKIGLHLIQGYGLTETSPVVAANNDFVNKPGSIGHPIKDVEVCIDSPDENGVGEILVKGRNVMLGYYEDEQATREAFDEYGWFKTGDLGKIDKQGFIYVTGRKKSMIVFTNGKKAFPEEYETILNNIAGVKSSFAWGNKAPDGDIQVCALLVLDKQKIIEQYGRLLSEDELSALYQEEIRKVNDLLPKYKIIRYFVLTWDDLILTTTLKIKRTEQYLKIKDALDKKGMEMRKANATFI